MPFERFEPYEDSEHWKKIRPCTSPEHDPPSHMVLKPGSYTWKCPSCGSTTTFIVPLITM